MIDSPTNDEPRLELDGLRTLNAGNRGPFTLDGTRTFIVGRAQPAVIDPGPESRDHVEALAAELADAERVTVVLTHGHPDHAGAVPALLSAISARPAGNPPVVAVVGSGRLGALPLSQGATVHTDHGPLLTHELPGHTADHLGFEWHTGDQRVLFVGDLLLGTGTTTWVAEYPGCVADYLDSLDTLDALDVDAMVPAHGPIITDPRATVAAYRAHRLERLAQVATAMEALPDGSMEAWVSGIYGEELPTGLLGAAIASVAAMQEYLAARND